MQREKGGCGELAFPLCNSRIFGARGKDKGLFIEPDFPRSLGPLGIKPTLRDGKHEALGIRMRWPSCPHGTDERLERV